MTTTTATKIKVLITIQPEAGFICFKYFLIQDTLKKEKLIAEDAPVKKLVLEEADVY
jgi:hypothetical protein